MNTPEETRRCSQALKTDFTLPGTASFKADTLGTSMCLYRDQSEEQS
uniref:Uncharacterized protein n=1 Tax=Rhizophora mucronata TaxID=61149 RepID=A0A2P2IHI2_RHIMU